MRSGKHKKLGAYQNKLDDTVPKECQRCDSGDDHTLEHWFLHCPGTMAAKRRIFFGEEEEGLGLLMKCPVKTIALSEETLVEDPPVYTHTHFLVFLEGEPPFVYFF